MRRLRRDGDDDNESGHELAKMRNNIIDALIRLIKSWSTEYGLSIDHEITYTPYGFV